MNIKLQAPLLIPDSIEEKIVCIRAHRERLFRVAVEEYDTKIIFHNYGQGGAGWTFLFGCVNESIRQFESLISGSGTASKSVCVVGAGCYGLLTALELTRRGHTVRIIADTFTNLTSEKAAGFFFPRPRKSSTPEEKEIFLARGIESYTTYLSIINGTHPYLTYGPQIVPAYYGLDIDPGFGPYIEEKLIKAPEAASITFNKGNTYDSQRYQALFINPPSLMTQLISLVKKYKILCIKQSLDSFNEIDETYIFNCSNLGARKLTNDVRLIPVQGHLITLKNQPNRQYLNYMLNMKVTQTTNGRQRDELIYFAPKGDGILGITFIRGEDSLTENYHEFDRLIDRCTALFGIM